MFTLLALLFRLFTELLVVDVFIVASWLLPEHLADEFEWGFLEIILSLLLAFFGLGLDLLLEGLEHLSF